MRFKAPWLILTSLVAMFTVAACGPNDESDAGPDECEARCDGDTAITCDADGNERETDCTIDFSSCIEVGGAVGCAAAVGDSCLVNGILSLCEGDEAGCVDDGAEDFPVCRENVGSCTDSQERTCDGEVLLSECEGGQPYLISCDVFGGTCESGTGCVMGEGDYCDDFDFFCADGLTCVDSFCE